MHLSTAAIVLIVNVVVWVAGGARDARGDVPASPLVSGRTGARVDAYLSRLAGFGYSGAVIVEKDGRLILSKGYGLADREAKRPVTPETVFTIGSITKQFTGAAILKLEMMGKLRVADPITKYFEEVPADKRSMTVHHLLTHTGGFPGAIGDDFDTGATRDAFMKEALATELSWAPGTRYEYSNVGYSILGIIIEKVSGVGYEAFLEEHLFKPAGMTRTGYLLPAFTDEALAVGYREGERWGMVLRRPMLDDGPSWHLRANGGIHSTALDMYRWHKALQGEPVLPEEAKQKLFASHVPEGPGANSFYGYGWAIFTTPRDTKLVARNGGNGIFSADFRHYVDEKVMFFHACNVAGISIDHLSNQIASVVFGLDYTLPPETVSLPEAELAAYGGTYRLDGGLTIRVTAKDGGLELMPAGQAALDAVAPGEALSEEVVARANARTQEMLERSVQGDQTELIQALSGDMAPEEVRRMAEERWEELEGEHGKFKSVDVLGSTRYRRRMIATTVRLDFERGPHFAQYMWFGSALRNARPLAGPPTFTFRPTGDDAFAYLDLPSGDVQRMTFSKQENGRRKMTLGSAADAVAAMAIVD